MLNGNKNEKLSEQITRGSNSPLICRCGGIGRHSGLKIRWPKQPYGFESRHRYHQILILREKKDIIQKGAVIDLMNVIKRNGTVEPFDSQKIYNAVMKAANAIDEPDFEVMAEAIARDVESLLRGQTDEVGIEDIQDLVEIDLYNIANSPAVAKAYITYRFKRNAARDYETSLFKELDEKYRATKVQNQNANVDEKSFGGRKGEADSVVAKKMAIDYLLSDKAKYNHTHNRIYIHDLDNYVVGCHNCLTIPFDDLLAQGFNTRQTDVRPAGSVNTAFQLIAVIFQLQSLQQFGGVSAGHLDWTMVPYVRKSFYKHYMDGWKYFAPEIKTPQAMFTDRTKTSIEDDIYKKTQATNVSQELVDKIYQYALDMTTREVHQGAEGLYHNLNTLQSRSGNQLPFTSINYGTCTMEEGRMVTKALLEVSIEGLGRVHKTSVFPCGIFQWWSKRNAYPGTPSYDLYRLALRSTAQRLYPNYANIEWSGNAGFDENDPCTYFSTMGCRTANGFDINGLGQRKDGRGNICPVTIILPQIAWEAKEEAFSEKTVIEHFMALLDEAIHDAKDMLIERFNWICSQPPESATFMYENNTMAGYVPEEGIRSALKHGTVVIGQLGLAEALQLLIGCDHTTEEGMALAKRIEQLFKDRCAEFKQEYKLNFGVYYTPAENLCYTAMNKFKADHGIIPNVSDRDYFTNSIHVPVWHKMSPFDKIDIEAQLTGYSSAGCITYVELDSTVKNNIDALEQIVNYAMEHDIPYFAVNTPNDTCLDCGFCDEFNDKCPTCGSEHIQQLRRVTGYLTGNYKTAFNNGKIAETEERVKHTGQVEMV